MKHFYFISVCFLVLLVFQVACGQTQTAVNNKDQNSTTNSSQPIPNSGVNKTKAREEVDYFAHLQPEHNEVLQEWLKTQPSLRPGVEEIDNSMFDENAYEDKEKFKENYEDNMKFLRETVGEKGYQYYSKGDFNRDGKEDFAVLLVDSRKEEEIDADNFALAIFNAPFKKGQPPNYYEEKLRGITNSYIVFDKMIEDHLYLGKFESDFYCITYFPKGKTYRYEDCL
jgi:hypothetical protein